MRERNKPQVIFLDAVGTIFGVKYSVGEAYAKIASKYGVKKNALEIDSCFYRAFKSSSPLAFSLEDKEKITSLEFAWWKKIAIDTFTYADGLTQFTDFDGFFQELYQYFRTAEPWYIYEDVIPCLDTWQKEGIELAIISNFDTRIYDVLENLNLTSYFQTITISSLTGVAKPNPQIFLKALEKHNCHPNNAWYIGDSIKEDYWGSKSVGMVSFWLNRDQI